MGQNFGQPTSIYNKLSTASMLLGILSIVCWCSPPVQFTLGAFALMLSWLGKNGKPMTPRAAVGSVTGGIAIVLSLFIFMQFIMALEMAKDPENLSLIREVYRQTKELMDGMAQSQPK